MIPTVRRTRTTTGRSRAGSSGCPPTKRSFGAGSRINPSRFSSDSQHVKRDVVEAPLQRRPNNGIEPRCGNGVCSYPLAGSPLWAANLSRESNDCWPASNEGRKKSAHRETLAFLSCRCNRASVVACRMNDRSLSTAGSRLRAARKAAGLTVAELGRRAAELTGRAKPISPSAVRNQENGTNGIPYVLASSYAKILGTTEQYILFGTASSKEYDSLNEVDKKYIDDAVDEFFIPNLSIASARWAEPAERSSSSRGLDFRVEGYEATDLTAHEVVDESLSPEFPKGSFLVAADVGKAGLHDGMLVIAGMMSSGIYLESIRRISIVDDGVDLVGVGMKPPQTIKLTRNGIPQAPIGISQVIVAACIFMHPEGGVIDLPASMLFLDEERRLTEDSSNDRKAVD